MADAAGSASPKQCTESRTPPTDPLAHASFWLAVATLAALGAAGLAYTWAGPDYLFLAGVVSGIALLSAVVAVALAAISRWRIAQWPNQLAGERRALLGGAIGLLSFFWAVFLPPVFIYRTGEPEVGASSTLRTLNHAMATYVSTYGQGLPESLHKLGAPSSGRPDANNADLVDAVLAGRAAGGTSTSFAKYGYTFTYSPGPRDAQGMIKNYTITATRHDGGYYRNFFTDDSYVIRWTSQNRDATAQDPPT